MFQVIKIIEFCYAHRLIGYSGKCCNLHGHNGKIEIIVETDSLNELGLSVDFREIKTIMQGWVDVNFDHKTILREDDPLVPMLQENGQRITTIKVNPTAKYLAFLAFEYGKSEGLPITEVRFWETSSSYVCYQEKLPV
jgi:6-pyruvoyltetrahydropterin/6-carboxytetrahydropterin synthase